MTQNIPTFLQSIHQLIALPSVSSVNPEIDQGNQAVVEQLAQWLEPMGFEIQLLPIPNTTNKFNLIATMGTGPGGLVLAGHTDTVPYDEQGWNSDPFKIREADQRLYGLGTSDMKGFFAVVLQAIQKFHARDLKQPLIILATADEESSMDGARDLVRLGLPKARYAVIGEPTGLRPINTHKGIMMQSVHVHGHSGHSSNPALGANALEGIHQVLDELLIWRRELQSRYRDARFEVPFPTLNLGRIVGGDNPNRICAECELQFDLRPLPGMDVHQLEQEFDQRLHQRLQDGPLQVEMKPLMVAIPPMMTNPDSEIVRAAERLTGHDAEAVAFCTEAPYFNQLGMESVILGPGDIDQAHQPNEYLALNRIQPMIDLLIGMIKRFCYAS